MFAHFLTGTRQSSLDTAAAVDRNLALAAELAESVVEALLDDPDLAKRVPPGATLVAIPDDDPDLRQYNLGLALEAFSSGRDVYLVHVQRGQGPVEPPTGRAAW